MVDEGPTVFEVRVSGDVPDDVLARLGGVEVTTRELRTLLRAPLRDQAELHGFLAQLRTYGLEVVEVRRATPADPDGPGGEDP
jgi:hypothetical protein